MLGLLIICLGCMPLKSLNQNWDIEDPNAEIPHLPENLAFAEDFAERGKGLNDVDHLEEGKAVHVENVQQT